MYEENDLPFKQKMLKSKTLIYYRIPTQLILQFFT